MAKGVPMEYRSLEGNYTPGQFEEEIYQYWMKEGFFESRVNPAKKPYTIVMPPPNVTGILTMGHILNNTIQDVLIRYYRMNGYEACWIPGTDHASIATEAKVTKYLAEKGINKWEIGREKFLEYAWEWKKKYGGIIIEQLKKLGTSCDWKRERFTMDDGYYRAVIHAFVKLYKKGYIYRGYRLVNWCPVSKSAISDEEVYYQEVEGHLWYFRYPIKDSHEFLVVATTRPETMLGDTAVAVNPNDKRYRHLIGKTVILPLAEREIPVIADEYVDPEFGTGVVKITPAHDPNDYEVALRHDLPMINIMNPDATLNDLVPEDFRGLDRYEAREAVVEAMKERKLLEKIEKYTHKVGYSERGHVPIEYYLSEQWYMKMSELVKPAIEVVKKGEITFYPERWTKVYFHWLENIKDWCISRQLWWGHRIPVYYCDACGFMDAYEQEPEKCPKCGMTMRQDPDVLDTWASSWIWPFAVHKWPDPDPNLDYYYPTDTLVTGPDIIFFWVARMIIAGMEFMGKIPFRRVYFTGIVRDDLGRKMSKSLGNSPDPLDVIGEYGADALRYTMTRLAPLGNDILYSNEKCELGRNFANKIWNASKFILSHLTGKPLPSLEEITLDLFDKWILSRYQQTISQVREAIEAFHFNEATVLLYDFIWDDFCSWYIEVSKVTLNQGNESEKQAKRTILLQVLEGSLKLLHPFMPFVTERIYLTLPGHEKTIMYAAYPEVNPRFVFEKEMNEAKLIQEAVYIIRNVRGENKIAPGQEVKVSLIVEKPEDRKTLETYTPFIEKLSKAKLHFISKREPEAMEAVGHGKGFDVYVSLEGTIDKEKELARFEEELERLQGQKKATEAKLANPNFTAKAPEAVIQKEKDKLAYYTAEIEKITKIIESLKG